MVAWDTGKSVAEHPNAFCEDHAMELLLSAATLSGDGGTGNEKLSQNFGGWAGRSEWSSISSRFLCRFEVNLRGVIIRTQ
jgi:hypothetical protein